MAYLSETTYSSDGVWISGTLTASNTAGAVFNWQNSENGNVLVDFIQVDLTTAATSTVATIDIGYTATNASTSSDTMIDGADISTNTGVYNSIINAGTNGKGVVKAAKGKWITASKKTGDLTGIAGKYYIHYMKERP